MRSYGRRRRPPRDGRSLSERLVAGLRHPARLVPAAFLAVIAVGTGLLMLPWATTSGKSAPLMDAAFTVVSCVCVTGLAVVDTATYWSVFGQVVMMLLIQVGGFGVMTLATLLSLLVGGRLGLAQRSLVQAETHAFDVESVRAVIGRVARAMLAAEGLIAVVLFLRFWLGHGLPVGDAAWRGVFHAISAFNNAGFALYTDNLVGFVGDLWIIAPICVAIVAGGLGYPVYFELRRRWRTPSRWTAHTRITVYGTLVLLVGGTLWYLLTEWTNPGTLGPLDGGTKVTAAATASVVARTAGFNSLDYGGLTSAGLVGTIALMFIGGGSAGTAGGVKVTTFFLLAHLILAEVRGEEDVTVGRRRIAQATLRQAVTVALLGAGTVMAGTIALAWLTGLELAAVAFEAVSAFATVGLSTGITAGLDTPARLVLMLLMFVGRVGTVTVASALALRQRKRRFRYPEERPIVG